MAIQAGDPIEASHYDTIVPIGVVLPYAGSSAPTGFFLCDGSAKSRTTYASLFAIIGTTFGSGDGSTTFNIPDMRSRVPVGAGSAGTFAISFLAGAVDTGSDQITIASNDTLKTGTAVVMTTTGALPGGLSTSTTYYVIYVSSTAIKLATSRANAVAGTAIDLTSQGSGTHTATVTYTARSLGAIGGEEQHTITKAELAVHTHIQNSHSHQANTSDSGYHFFTAKSGGSQINPWATSGNGYTKQEQATTGDTTATNQNEGGSQEHNVMNPYVALNFIIKYIAYS